VRRALVNARVIDGTGGNTYPGTVILDDDRVAAVLEPGELASDIQAIDLHGQTVMPGLIDCHVHFALWSLDLLAHQDKPLSYLIAQTFRALSDAVRAGCTAARDPGGLDAGICEAVREGLALGPRLQTSVAIVSPINGIADGSKRQGVPVPAVPGMPTGECTGPIEARAKVRELVRAGADFIKVAVTGGVSSPRREPRQRLFTEEELIAIVDEAHAWGRPVACHALGGPGLLSALRAGVDTIEHGVWLEDEAIAEMVRRGTWYVPTLSAYEWHARAGGPLQQARAREMVSSHRDSVRRAYAAGVRIVSGSDGGVYGHDFTAEPQLLVAAGLSAADAVVASTSRAAACLGWANDVGRVAAGQAADLLIIEGDPSQDIGVLRGPSAPRVVRSGVPVDGSWPQQPGRTLGSGTTRSW
jgi:imidazolonepropionase-like amidohydrolase